MHKINKITSSIESTNFVISLALDDSFNFGKGCPSTFFLKALVEFLCCMNDWSPHHFDNKRP